MPSQAQRIVASEKRSEESPLEQVVKEEEASAWATASAPTGMTDNPTDPQGYELNRSTTRALIDFDSPLRDMLVGIDKRTMELKHLEHLEKLESAFSSVKYDWPFAKIGIKSGDFGS